jgi:hypothetical protein
MTGTFFKSEPQENPFPIRRISLVLALGTVFFLVVTAVGFYYFYPSRIGMLQPIPFSHRVHVTEKKLSCVMCHSEVFDTDQAGIPPLDTCMLCHSRIIIHQPKIVQLRKHYYDNQPVTWNRISYLPDLCFFSHQAHIHRGIDCGKCHGEVDKMDRVVLINNFKMGFCVQCHRDEGVSHDCLICHR